MLAFWCGYETKTLIAWASRGYGLRADTTTRTRQMLGSAGAISVPLRMRQVPLCTLYARVPDDDVPNIWLRGVRERVAMVFVVCQIRKNRAVVADHANCRRPSRV